MSLEDIERRLRVVEDVAAIKNLKAQYCAYCDEGYNTEGIAGLFVEDGVWDGGGPDRYYQGRDAIRSFFAEASNLYSFALHYVFNPIISVDGDKAHGRWYLFMPATLPDGNRAIWNAGRYEDDYVRINGEWMYQTLRIAERYFTTSFDQGWAKQRFVQR